MPARHIIILILCIAALPTACSSIDKHKNNVGIALGKIKADSMVCEPIANTRRTLCAINTTNEGPRWYLIGKFDAISLNIDSEFVVFKISASPDGHYAAICSASEGHPVLQIVDTTRLLETAAAPVLYSIPFNSGWIEIAGWQDDELLINSDSPLIEQPGNTITKDATANYSLNLKSGDIHPLSLPSPE